MTPVFSRDLLKPSRFPLLLCRYEYGINDLCGGWADHLGSFLQGSETTPLPSLKLAAFLWKSMVGRWKFLLGIFADFQGHSLLVLGEGKLYPRMAPWDLRMFTFMDGWFLWQTCGGESASPTADGRNPAPVEVGILSHYLQGFINPSWWRNSSINSMNPIGQFWPGRHPVIPIQAWTDGVWSVRITSWDLRLNTPPHVKGMNGCLGLCHTWLFQLDDSKLFLEQCKKLKAFALFIYVYIWGMQSCHLYGAYIKPLQGSHHESTRKMACSKGSCHGSHGSSQKYSTDSDGIFHDTCCTAVPSDCPMKSVKRKPVVWHRCQVLVL